MPVTYALQDYFIGANERAWYINPVLLPIPTECSNLSIGFLRVNATAAVALRVERINTV
jgi:hypothetical protein